VRITSQARLLMSSLQKFKELVKEAEAAEAELTKLTKQNETLKQEGIQLAAKRQYLTHSISIEEDKLNALKADLASVQSEQQAILSKDKQAIAAVEDDLKRLQTLQAELSDSIKAAEASHTREITKFEAQLHDTQAGIAIAEADLKRTRAEEQALRDSLTELRDEIATNSDALAARQAAEAQTTSELLKEQGRLKSETERFRASYELAVAAYEETLARVKVADEELQAAITKADEFAERERRAIKALEAREQSLKDRENKLEEATKRAQRSGILDNA
jgi:chromosome segregation ATPase